MEHIEAHTMKLLGTVPAATMKSSAVYFKPGDVLYGRLRPYLNKVYRPTFEGLCSAEFIVLPETERLDGKYLQYFLNSGAFVRFASHLNAGDRPRVDFDQIAARELPVPPVDMQRCIVAEIERQFSRLDEAVANLQRVKANLKRYKAAVLKGAVEARIVQSEADSSRRHGRGYETGAALLRRIIEARHEQWTRGGKYKSPEPADQRATPEIPEGWTWATLDQLTIQIADVDHKMPKATEGGVPYVSTKDFTGDDGIDFSGAKRIAPADYQALCRKVTPSRGDILLSRYGTVGEVRVVAVDVPFQASYSIAILKPVCGFGFVDFIATAMRSDVVQTQIKRDVRATAQPDLGLAHIRQFIVPLPPLAEQHRIVAEIDRRLSIVREVEAEVDANLKRAQVLRQAVLQGAFACKLLP
jgi:type I restriction enzyme S subunit